jgi:hypothetical protein
VVCAAQLTLLFVAVLCTDADTLAGQRAQEGVRHSKEHTEQGHAVHADAAQQADDGGNGKRHEAHTLSAEQCQQHKLRLGGVALRLGRLRAERVNESNFELILEEATFNPAGTRNTAVRGEALQWLQYGKAAASRVKNSISLEASACRHAP